MSAPDRQLKLFSPPALTWPVPAPGSVVVMVIRSEDFLGGCALTPAGPAPVGGAPGIPPEPDRPKKPEGATYAEVADWVAGGASRYPSSVERDERGRVVAFPSAALIAHLQRAAPWRDRSERSVQTYIGKAMQAMRWQRLRPRAGGRVRLYLRPASDR